MRDSALRVRAVAASRPTRASRSGLTLIEVLVVVFILGILAALVLPAIQRARVAARRVQCSSRLRQMGQALTLYHDSHQLYPAGSRFSVHAVLLPQLGYEPLFNQINFSLEPFTTYNAGLAKTRIEIFRCPSDYAPFGGAGTNYLGNSGLGARWFGEQFNDDGAFYAHGGFGLRQHNAAMFRDGLANTVAFSESCSRTIKVNPPILPASPANRELFIQSCQALPQKASSYGKGGIWMDGALYQTLYNHMIAPNGPSCINGGDVNTMAYTASSLHGAGVNVTMMDSSARFISEKIDIGTWRAISTRAGGEVVQQF